MVKALSHVVLATYRVEELASFFEELFEIKPHYKVKGFCEFVLPDKSRLAFFTPVGKASRYFSGDGEGGKVGLGLTVSDVDRVYSRVLELQGRYSIEVSGPPREHPWGEKSFLLVDSDQNRWEITQSPTDSGKLKNLGEGKKK